jgi:hypothetical protein
MAHKTFRIVGRVIDQTGQGVEGLRVEAWDKDLFFDDLVGNAETGSEGSFEMKFKESYFKEIFARRPDLYFKIFRKDELIPGAEFEVEVQLPTGKIMKGLGDAVFWKVASGTTNVTIKLQIPVASQLFKVKGTILQPDGTPVTGAVVKAVDKDLRHEEELGEATTSQSGRYEITYTPQQFYRAEKKSADLIVRVFDKDDPGLILAASSILFNAPAVATIDRKVESQLSEFERLFNELAPLLKIDNVALADLSEEDIVFLAGETGFEKKWLRTLADAARITAEADLELDLSVNDVTAIFYGLGRKGRLLILNELLGQDFFVLRRMLEDALDENIIPHYLSASLDAFFAELDRLVSESGLDKPVSHIAVQQKNLQHIGEFVGLDSAKITRLIAKAVTFAGINDTTLRLLVEADELQENEAKQVGLAVSLYHLFDADMMLMEAVKSGTFPQLPQGSVIDIKDLVAFDTADWLDILTQADSTPPDDLGIEEYAVLLSKKIEKLYPSDTLLARLIRTDENAIKKHIGILQPVFDKKETVFGVGSSKKMAIEKSKQGETEKQGNAHSALSRLVNQYKGLNLAEILDNRELSAEDKAAQLSERIGLLLRFQLQNPDAEVLALDYAPESEDVAALEFDDFTPEEKQVVLSCFKSYQRTYAVSEDVEHCQALMTAGYDSALKIVNDSQENFQTHSGLSADISHDIYEASLETAGTTATLVGSIIDVVQGGFDWTDVSNQSPSTVDYLKKIEGFEELFGNQDYCKCQHCQSLLSPAAYFVDLMSFVEKKISAINFSDDQQDHVLNLKRRRRDLWELQLTCKNTHGLIPYLDIINEVLENYIYVSEQGENEEELPARSVIESYVYEQKISQFVNSFQLPKLLPLQKLEAYLSHFDVTRGEMAKLLEQDSYIVAAAVLKLSSKEFELVTQSNQNLNFFKRLYGIDFKIDPESGCIKKFDAQELLSPMGLSRTELGELIKTRYVTTSSQETIQIKGEKEYEESVQEDIERIVGLTPLSLDRMHRLVRLWRQLSWSISELDLVLSHLNEEDLSAGIDDEDTFIDEDTLLHLVTLLELQNRFAISVEEMCALWTSIPQEMISAQEESLFDRLFNLAEFVSLDGNYPKSSTLFTHPAFEGDNNGENNDLHRLLAGLRVNDEQLYQLIFHLSDPLGLNLEPDEGEEYKPDFALNIDNLSLLYRHARLAQRLNVTIPQLFQLTGQEQSVGSSSINGLNDLSTFLDYYDWWRSTDYSIDDISYILDSQITNSDAYPNAKDLATQILVEIHKDGALTFADTVFAYLDNVTEEQSKIIIETNSGWIKNVPDSTLYWLTSSFDSITLADDPRAGLTFLTSIFSHLKGISSEQSELIVDANPGLIEKVEIQNPHGRTITVCHLSEHFDPNVTLTIPADITIDEAEAKKLLLAYYNAEEGVYLLLMAYHTTEVIPLYFARHFDFTVDKIKSLIAMTGVDLAAPEFVTAVQSTEQVADEIIDLIEKLLRLSTLFRGKFFDADALDFVNQEKREVFGIDDLNALLIQNIRRISLYADFISGIEGHSSLDDLQDVLRNAADNATLARVLNAEPSLIITLLEHLTLPSTPLEALDKLRSCVEMIKCLGIGSEALSLVVSEDYDALTRAGDAILGAFRAKYDDEKEWNEKIAPYEEKIRTLKRDMLTDYLVHSEDYPWCTCDKDLYYYFLLDVELEGCARTSRVVAAISSVQLYVHRVLMNLEQSEAGDIHVTPQNPKEFIKEWEWRKNYRVWEANRKVFLYPENWIEPELRDNKTPLFEALESELLQQEINEQTVLDAYANYMRGFEEVSHLKIAGSYHEKDKHNKKDILHLFGVTSDEPPIYYYRGIENAHYGERESNRGIVWSPWRKIDVQIPVSKVSPIMFRGRLHVFWVEFTTRPKNEVKYGSSEFVGYQHKMSLKYTSLRLDGSWTTPQNIRLDGVSPFDKGEGIIEDLLKDDNDDELAWNRADEEYVPYPGFDALRDLYEEFLLIYHKTPKYDDGIHTEPKDGYTLTGYSWDQIYPVVYLDKESIEQLVITGRDWELIAAPVDFYKRTIKKGRDKLFPEVEFSATNRTYRLIHSYIDPSIQTINYFSAGMQYQIDYTFSSLLVNSERAEYIASKTGKPDLDALIPNHTTEIGTTTHNGQLKVVNGSIEDIIIDSNGDLLLLQSLERDRATHLLNRLGTTLSEKVARTLLTRGVDGLLDIDTQKGLIENPSPITKTGDYIDDSHIENKPDFKGAFGTYYREIFFHIPFLIANHLNSQQKFPEAQKWYHYIFNPTAGKESNVFGTDFTPHPEGQIWEQNDSKWRYIEFRNIDINTLRDKLTNNDEAIEVYRKDPFNPHAIARLRLSAYQKTIVMKYIDNLLDWGDQLFTQDTMESINEASLLYVLASDILGERPAELGECSEIPVVSRNYESIKEVLDEDSPFLIEMEYFTVTGHRFNYASPAKASQYTLDPVTANHATQNAYASLATALSPANQPVAAMHSVDTAASIISEGESAATEAAWDVGLSMAMDWSQASAQMHPQYHPQGWLEFASQLSPVFCVPENKGLKQYWDRVEDRLYKIRNCMNISGVRRELSLFAPEIDPGLLVRAKAAGLSVEDVLNAISGNLPPYRFAYIIDKAKSYAGAVQGFGSALLSALEKKDVEELTLLRTVHEQNIMKMTKQVKQWEIDAADENVEALKRKEETVQHRRDYYQLLIDEGRTPWEITQAVAQHGAAGLRGLAASFNTYGAIAYLVPQVGSPFAMKYGGKEQGDSGSSWSEVFRALAEISDTVATSAGFEANLERRDQGWKFQLEQADHELKELAKQKAGAVIHKYLVKRSLELHEESSEQLNEVYEFYGEKFSNLGLYTWLSSTLQRLYREAYNSAYSMAKLAEQTYRFERSDDTSELLGSSHWEASKAGLLAGERLSIDLQNLERKFIETNYRSLEINQSFSLTQIAPTALIELRETGSCEFEVSEIFFDLFYPGHYRRKIKFVRLTIPCVTGPYTNVSATLTLVGSNIRVEPKVGENELKSVPRTRTLSIATSSAQNDAGVFELNFRDERYMPFEGAGAVSRWKLSLPKNFRQFDYQTISDVLIHVSYTAEEDGVLREKIEGINAMTEGSIQDFLTEHSLPRVFSFRHDFSNEFHRLLHSPIGKSVMIELTDKHFPMFLKGKSIQVKKAIFILGTPKDQSITDFEISINGASHTAADFTRYAQYGDLWSKDLDSPFSGGVLGEHTFIIKDAGDLVPDSPAPSDSSAIDSKKLTDIYLYLEYGIN